MHTRLCAAASIFIVALGAVGSGTAHADPPGNTPNDAPNARIFCEHLDRNPTVDGFVAAFRDIRAQVSEDDAVDAVSYAMMYTCPQYRPLLDQAVNR